MIVPSRRSWVTVSMRAFLATLFGAACSLLNSPFAEAQQATSPLDLRTAPYIGVGYVGTAPAVLTGIGATALLGGWGLTVDVQGNLETPRSERGFEENITPQQARSEFGDFFFRDRSAWRLVNVAVVRAVTSEIAVYAGAGLADEDAYIQFADPSATRGFGGYYWVHDEDASGVRTGLVGGLFFQAGRNLWFQLGGASAPAGARVGASYMIPLRSR
jgi:hypothetical protein